MPATTSVTLNAATPSGSIPIALPGVRAGTAALGVFAGAPTGQTGLFLNPSPDFVGSFQLSKHSTLAGPYDDQRPSLALRGDQVLLIVGGPGPLVNLVATDSITCVLASIVSGSLVVSVVQ